MDASLAPWLAVAAQLSGLGAFAPVSTPAPVVQARVVAAPRAVGAISLAEIAARTGAWVRKETAGMTLDFAVDIGPDEAPRLLMREGGQTLAYSLDALSSGAVARLPDGTLKLGYRDGLVAAGTVSLSINDLLLSAYQRASRVEFPFVAYAALLEGSPDKPTAIALLRRDAQGVFWASYHPVSQLGAVDWLVGVDGILYGMRLDGALLTFWSEPAPAVLSLRSDLPIL